MNLDPTLVDTLSKFATQAWFAAHRLAGYALLNLLDDPAILAMAFC
jgi:hypothetical protein